MALAVTIGQQPIGAHAAATTACHFIVASAPECPQVPPGFFDGVLMVLHPPDPNSRVTPRIRETTSVRFLTFIFLMMLRMCTLTVLSLIFSS
jgi:hypothetical protein